MTVWGSWAYEERRVIIGCLDAMGDGGDGGCRDGWARDSRDGSCVGNCRIGIALGTSWVGMWRWAWDERRERVGCETDSRYCWGNDGGGGTGLVGPACGRFS
jgi:hypothetical protein